MDLQIDNTIKHTGRLLKAHKTDSGYDMFNEVDTVIQPGCTVKLSTGVALHLLGGIGATGASTFFNVVTGPSRASRDYR